MLQRLQLNAAAILRHQLVLIQKVGVLLSGIRDTVIKQAAIAESPSEGQLFRFVGSKKARNKSISIECLNRASEESIRKIREEAERMAALFELLAIKEGNVTTPEAAEVPAVLPIELPPPGPAPPGISP